MPVYLITFVDKNATDAQDQPQRRWLAEDANEVKNVVNLKADYDNVWFTSGTTTLTGNVSIDGFVNGRTIDIVAVALNLLSSTATRVYGQTSLNLSTEGSFLINNVAAVDPATQYFRADGTWSTPENHFRGIHVSLVALQTAVPAGNAGDYAFVDAGVGTDAQQYIYDVDDASWVLSSGTSGVTTFNGRTGIVTPQSGDYTKAQVGLTNVDNTSDATKESDFDVDYLRVQSFRSLYNY